jgi:DnaJ-class molecular chaperone
LTLKYHPDMPTGNGAKMTQILDAYAFLKNQLKA